MLKSLTLAAATISERGIPSMLDWLGALATLGTFAAAVVALVYAHWQIQNARKTDAENRNLAKEMDALNAYERYHELMLRYPKLAKGFDFRNASAEDQTQYEIFVLGMMLTIERVLVLLPNDANWEPALADDLQMHKEFLCSEHWAKECVALVNPLVADFIRKAAKDKKWPYPYRGPHDGSQTLVEIGKERVGEGDSPRMRLADRSEH